MSIKVHSLNLHPLFNPQSVAVIGASENPSKLGSHVMRSLIEGGFAGRIVPVNPKSKEIMGIPASASVIDFPEALDLAIVVVPATRVPRIFHECRHNKVKGMVLITAGFKEIDDPEGGRQQDLLRDMALDGGIPVIGPNTFGIINLHRNLNASFTPEFSKVNKGKVALVSQSGGISHLLAFLAMQQNVGFSKIVGLGNRLNIDFAEMLDFLMTDPDTEVIALYLEGLDNPARLLQAAAGQREKPIIAYKTGSARAGDQASLSHTGSMAGNHAIYRGALRQAGIFCTRSSQALLDLAQTLAVCARPGGPRVAVLTGQAGPGMAACDVIEAQGLRMATFGAETQAAINAFLPPLAMRSNPVDMGPAWYDSGAIQGIVKAAAEDDGVDGIILLMMFASANREALPNLAPFLLQWRQRKPIIACCAAPPGIWDADLDHLQMSDALVNLPTPERAAEAMAALFHYTAKITLDGRKSTWI
jgi:acyl-CoA synthetase (NDP forming)